MYKTYQYWLKPNQETKKILESILEQDRSLYNAALQERKEAYDKCGVSISYYDQHKSLTQIRKDGYDGHRARQKGSLARIDRAFKDFFRRVKKGQKPGFPRFKSKDRWDSIEIASQYRIKNNKFYTKDFPNGIKIHLHRDLPNNLIKHCGAILKKNAKGWQINFRIQLPDVEKIEPKNMVGIDLGLNSFISTSEGEFFDAPKHYRKTQKKLKRQQRALARCKKVSNTRKKRKLAFQKTHMKIYNQRKDFQHKLSRYLINNYDLIVVENLKIKNMVKNHNLSKSIMDAAWAMFLAKVAYKAEEAGKHFIKVDPKYTSQHCSGCGVVVEKPLSVRVHRCQDCGLEMDRDHNAAINILNKGLGISLGSLNFGLPKFDSEVYA